MGDLYHGTDEDFVSGTVLGGTNRRNYQPGTYAGDGVYLTGDPALAYFYAVFGAFSSGRFDGQPHVYTVDAPDARPNQPGEFLAPSAVVLRDVTDLARKKFASEWEDWKPMVIRSTPPGTIPTAAMIVDEFESRIKKHTTKEAAVATNGVRFGIVDSTDPERALEQLMTLDSDGDGVPNIRDKAPFDPKVSAYVNDLARQASTFNRTPNQPVKPVNDWDKDVMHSVTKEGGFTFHNVVGDGPTKGYMVSVAKSNEVKVPLRDLTSAHVADYMSLHQQELKDPNNYLGGWVHKGNVYLDISRHTHDHQEAMSLARANKQLGIYDIGKGETLMTEQENAQNVAPKAAFVIGRVTPDNVGGFAQTFVNSLRAQANLEPLPSDVPATAVQRAALRVVRDDDTA